jgi:hypothetical protein
MGRVTIKLESGVCHLSFEICLFKAVPKRFSHSISGLPAISGLITDHEHALKF